MALLDYIGRIWATLNLGRTAAELRRIREELEAQRRQRNQQQDERQESEEDARWQMFVTILTEEQRQALTRLTADLSDARIAVAHAHDRAQAEEESARKALESARGRAVVPPDGRRVYFAADGSALYTEDGDGITDHAAIADARLRVTPSATTYEEVAALRVNLANAEHVSEQLRTSLAELDEIDSQLSREDVSPEQIQMVRERFDHLMEGLPADARAEYEQLRSVREGREAPSYRAADPTFETELRLSERFGKAAAPMAAPDSGNEVAKDPDRTLVYRSAPDF